MFCPYAVNRHLAQQTIYEYDESGATTLTQVIEHDTSEFVKCLQEQCGAWRNGECCYYKS